MTMLIDVVAILFVWLIFGVTGFLYWWTKEHDVYGEDLIVVILGAMYGPMAWLYGYIIHGKKWKSHTPIIKRRSNNQTKDCL